MKEWLPIETAPKDGTRVLLWSLDADPALMPVIGEYDDDGPEPWGAAWWQDPTTDHFPIDADPTHWLPLPGPPQE